MQMPVVPKASPDVLPELATYLAPFAPLFRRATSRASVERYLTGLLTDLERKNCDTIAAAVVGTSTECFQLTGCKFSREHTLLSLALVEVQNKGRVWCRQKNVR
jgi:hypothetical protein